MQERFHTILYEKKGGIAYLTLNRPERLNAIDPSTNEELLRAWLDFRDDEGAWVAILSGAGERAFSTGADLAAVAEGCMGPDGTPTENGILPLGIITRNFRCYQPMIAAINGYCVASGLEMALACDILIASENAQSAFLSLLAASYRRRAGRSDYHERSLTP